MFGCVEKISTKLSLCVDFFASVWFSSSFLSAIPFAWISAESAFTLSGSAINNALKAVLFFCCCLFCLMLRRLCSTIVTKPVESFSAPFSTIETLCLSA